MSAPKSATQKVFVRGFSGCIPNDRCCHPIANSMQHTAVGSIMSWQGGHPFCAGMRCDGISYHSNHCGLLRRELQAARVQPSFSSCSSPWHRTPCVGGMQDGDPLGSWPHPSVGRSNALKANPAVGMHPVGQGIAAPWGTWAQRGMAGASTAGERSLVPSFPHPPSPPSACCAAQGR